MAEGKMREKRDGWIEGKKGSVPASHGGFGQTSGGRQRLGASDWRKVRRRSGPQQHGDR